MGGRRITDKQKCQIRELYANGESVAKIAKQFNVSDASVYTLTRNLSRDAALMGDGEYRTIPGFDERYRISSSGHIVSLAQGGRAKNIKSYPSRRGRKAVVLSSNDGLVRTYIDELVAKVFIGEGEDGQRLVHIDGDFSNDSADNLQWEDIPVAVSKKRVISDEVVESIRCDWLNRVETSEICSRYDVSQSFVCNKTKDLLLDIPAPDSEPGEQWADIEGFEGRYLVSSHGRVYSTGCGRRSPAMLKPNVNSRGYQTVNLSDGHSNNTTARVHRLVALAFCDSHSESRDIVNHKDGNPSNNHADNLEWCTSGENTRHAIDVLGRSIGGSEPFKRISTRIHPVDANSTRSPFRRFSDEDVEFIRTDYHSSRQLAKMFGVNKSTIQRIRSGESYRNI